MITATTRARITGLLVVAGAFAVGALAGHAWASRPTRGVVMTVTSTDELPRELTMLDLEGDQIEDIRTIIRASRIRVLSVLEEMEPRMRAVLDATDREIGAVLSDDQRTRWEAWRRQQPPRTERRFIER